ncbi:MAG: magnesium transporter [Chlamydiales bacterium]|nr:magnesium transporter [Chlamydiales bacterium]
MDSKTSHLDDLLSEKLEDAFHKQTSKVRLNHLAKIASEHTPIDLAYAASKLPPSARHVLFENLPDLDAQIIFIINTDGNTRAAIFRNLDDKGIQQLIQKMPPDEAVWVLDDLPDRRYRRIIDLLDSKKAAHIKELQKHDRNSAGRLMTNEFFAFTMDITIGEAAASIRDNPGIDLTRRIFVLNHAGELQGYVPARNLIVNPPNLPLRQVMRSILHKVNPDTSRDEVVDLVERYKIPALPVVDVDNFLVGVVTYEDVVEAIEDIADETIARMAGTAEDVSAHEPVFKRFLSRAPWLVVTVCGGLISAAIMAYYQSLESNLLAFIVFFVPLITGISGNVGIQCSTVLVRSMAIGVLSSGNKGSAVSKEMVIGLSIGVVFGIFCGFAVYLLHISGMHQYGTSSLESGLMVGVGVFGACLTSTLLGVSSPLFFARLGVDPAVAAGPIVTAFNDIISMIMYFVSSGLINSLFSF